MIDCTIPAVSIQGYQDQANNTELLPTHSINNLTCQIAFILPAEGAFNNNNFSNVRQVAQAVNELTFYAEIEKTKKR